jgi:hypothetical protein
VAADKAFCQGEEVFRKFIAANPVAVLHGTVTPNVTFNACVKNPTFDANIAAFGANITANVSGSLAVHLKFENKTPPGVGLCKADWADDFQFQASAAISDRQLSFSVSGEPEGDGLNLVFGAGDQIFKVNFKPAPLDELFIKHPKTLVNCNVAAGLAAGYVSYDTVVNEQLKNASPLLTGKDYKLTVKDLQFKIKVPRLDVKSLSDKVLISMTPNWRSKTIAFLK